MNTSPTQTKKKKRQPHYNSIFSDRVRDIEQIEATCHKHVKRFGYDYVSYTGYFPTTDTSLTFSDFPEQWRASNQQTIGSKDNPVVVFSKTATSPFYWDEILNNSSLNIDTANAFIESALQSDIHDGLCIPVHGAGYEWGVLGVAKANGKNKKTNTLYSMQQLLLFAKELHEKLKYIAVSNSEKQANQAILSPRESECLDWIAAGKTAWEAAQIMGVTESTVSFHLRNVMNKLNVSNRTHAVAVGMARYLINNPANHNYNYKI